MGKVFGGRDHDYANSTYTLVMTIWQRRHRECTNNQHSTTTNPSAGLDLKNATILHSQNKCRFRAKAISLEIRRVLALSRLADQV